MGLVAVEGFDIWHY